ncbi:putative calcium homeostasis protein [Botrytis fragariae]|uniref:Putative calcium homeostasis protein n=1 Tax=Botrytis fragariae TaxID=1964551 RepID=A0A8H6AR41_9HELO|nr:putative calcium homeostasis protein [Botrytis fragariae]KAF5872094.1 putative calcium homeostasis protein [Botrytis fragariae]
MSGSVTTWSAEGPLLPRNLDFKKIFVAEDETIHLIATKRIHIIGTLKVLRNNLRRGNNDLIFYTIMKPKFQPLFCVEVEGYSDTLFVATKKKLGFVENYRQLGERDSRVVSETISPRFQSDVETSDNLRYTGGSVDSKGRVWLMISEGKNSPGRLFHLDKDWKPSNRRYVSIRRFGGIGWSLDDKTIYIHEPARNDCIIAYDFNIETGIIEMDKDRLFYEFKNPMEYPMAFVIDSEDHMWCAVAGTSRIIRISPKSEVVGEIHLPPPHEPIDLQFVGNELIILTKRIRRDEIFLMGGTSHKMLMNAKEASHGNIFTVDTGYTGKPRHLYKLSLEELSLLKNSGLSLGDSLRTFIRGAVDFFSRFHESEASRNA